MAVLLILAPIQWDDVFPQAPIEPPLVIEVPTVSVSRGVSLQPFGADLQPAAPAALSLEQILTGVWLTGAALVLLYHLAGTWRFIRRANRWSYPAGEEIPQVYEGVCREMGLKKAPPLCRSAAVDSPMVTGLFRPRLLLPDEDMGARELAFILRHELTHYRRHDLWYKLVLLLANALHWFNPLIWLLRRESEKDLELTCDDAVVAGADAETRRAYSETLLASIHRQRQRAVLSTHFYGGNSVMKERFRNILGKQGRKQGIAVFMAALAVTVAAAGAIELSAKAKEAPQPSKEALTAVTPVPVSPPSSVSPPKEEAAPQDPEPNAAPPAASASKTSGKPLHTPGTAASPPIETIDAEPAAGEALPPPDTVEPEPLPSSPATPATEPVPGDEAVSEPNLPSPAGTFRDLREDDDDDDDWDRRDESQNESGAVYPGSQDSGGSHPPFMLAGYPMVWDEESGGYLFAPGTPEIGGPATMGDAYRGGPSTPIDEQPIPDGGAEAVPIVTIVPPAGIIGDFDRPGETPTPAVIGDIDHDGVRDTEIEINGQVYPLVWNPETNWFDPLPGGMEVGFSDSGDYNGDGKPDSEVQVNGQRYQITLDPEGGITYAAIASGGGAVPDAGEPASNGNGPPDTEDSPPIPDTSAPAPEAPESEE